MAQFSKTKKKPYQPIMRPFYTYNSKYPHVTQSLLKEEHNDGGNHDKECSGEPDRVISGAGVADLQPFGVAGGIAGADTDMVRRAVRERPHREQGICEDRKKELKKCGRNDVLVTTYVMDMDK